MTFLSKFRVKLIKPTFLVQLSIKTEGIVPHFIGDIPLIVLIIFQQPELLNLGANTRRRGTSSSRTQTVFFTALSRFINGMIRTNSFGLGKIFARERGPSTHTQIERVRSPSPQRAGA